MKATVPPYETVCADGEIVPPLPALAVTVYVKSEKPTDTDPLLVTGPT